MPLPTIVPPTFTSTFPDGSKFTYRQFNTEEQKNLLIVANSSDEANLVTNMVNLVDACTFNKFDFRNRPVADFEKAFLAIRAQSVNDVIELTYRCTHQIDKPIVGDPDGNTERKECGHRSSKEIKFLDLVTFSEPPNPLIDITDTIKMKMKPVTMGDIIDGITNGDTTDYLRSKVECVIDGDEVYTEFTSEEFKEFSNNFPTSAQELIVDYFDNYSKALLKIPTKCKRCGNEAEIVIEGAVNFFG